MEIRTVRGPLPPDALTAVHSLVAFAVTIDGIAPLDEAALLAQTDEAAPALHLLAWEQTPAGLVVLPRPFLAGYAVVDLGGEVPTAQLVVDPFARWRGFGRALLDAAVAATPDGTLDVWAHGDLPPSRMLAAAAGFARVHELWRMSLDLPSRPEVPADWPSGIVVRAFRPGQDEDAWLAVNARAFADHPEQGRWTRRDVEAREAEPWFDPAGLLLAWRDDALAGFVWTKVHPAGELAGDEVGEVYVLGVDPAAQRLGLGRALTAAGLDHLAGRGLRTAVLWVAGDNAAAIGTYHRAGFERVGLDVRYARRPAEASGSPDGATMDS